MKKLFTCILAVMIVCSMVVSVSALDWYENALTNSFDTLPEKYNNAVQVQLSEYWIESTTNARHGEAEGFDYIYLKADDLGDFTVTFSVPEDGLYEFGFMLMAWNKSVLRATNFAIDDAEPVRIAYDYVDEDQFKSHYWYGVSAILTAGEHTLSLSLPEDFDDSTVKTVYMERFFYTKGELPVEEAPEEEAPVVDEAPAEAPEEAPAVEATPVTADTTAVCAAITLAALACVVIAKKRR